MNSREYFIVTVLGNMTRACNRIFAGDAVFTSYCARSNNGDRRKSLILT
jgi:hypothetical protein